MCLAKRIGLESHACELGIRFRMALRGLHVKGVGVRASSCGEDHVPRTCDGKMWRDMRLEACGCSCHLPGEKDLD